MTSNEVNSIPLPLFPRLFSFPFALILSISFLSFIQLTINVANLRQYIKRHCQQFAYMSCGLTQPGSPKLGQFKKISVHCFEGMVKFSALEMK